MSSVVEAVRPSFPAPIEWDAATDAARREELRAVIAREPEHQVMLDSLSIELADFDKEKRKLIDSLAATERELHRKRQESLTAISQAGVAKQELLELASPELSKRLDRQRAALRTVEINFNNCPKDTPANTYILRRIELADSPEILDKWERALDDFESQKAECERAIAETIDEIYAL